MRADGTIQIGFTHAQTPQRAERVLTAALRKAGRLFVALVAATALLLPLPAHAQTLYGTLVGNVTDSSGAAVAGAVVTATDPSTGLKAIATTDSSGGYRVSNLTPGSYIVSVNAQSFSTVTSQALSVQANIEQRFDAKLQPGTVGQSIVVTTAAPELQTDTATVSSELETTEVRTLVTTAGFNMRNFQSLFQVLPGFSPPNEQHSEAGNPADTMMFNANGVSGSNNTTKVDGVSDIYAWLPEITAYTPSTEAIGSINVVTNSMNAEQGFASGAAVNVTTKSGTNKFHGSAWEYNMISALMAKPYFTPKTNALPKYVLNQFGGNLGGPILRNKAFFFGNFEATRRSQAASGNQTVPSQAMLNGIFTGVYHPTTVGGVTTNVPVVIYDPLTGNPDGTGRQPFPNNVIPANRISHAASQMIALLESNNNADLPNVAAANLLSDGGIGNDFYGSADSEYTRNNVDTRVDFNLTSKSTLFGRYGFQDTNIFAPQALGAAGGGTFAVNGSNPQPGNAPSLIQYTGVGGTYAFRPNLLLDANFGYLRQGMSAKNTDLNKNWGTDYFGIPGTNGACSLCGGQPGFNFTTISGMGNTANSNPFQFRDNTYVSAANLSWTKGKHATRYGMEFDRFSINHFQPQNTYGPRGGFQFTGGLTALTGGAAPDVYNSWADFLLGLPHQLQKDTQYLNPATNRENVWAFYAQDQWQATAKLTINYGIRYEYYPIATRDHTGLDIFNPADGKIYIEGAAGVPPTAQVHVGKGLVVPRLGFAYRITPKTVARVGFGLSANPDSYRNVLTTYPSVVSQTIVGNTATVSPLIGGLPDTIGEGPAIPASSYYDGIPTLTPPTLSPSSPSVALGTLGTPPGTLGATTLPLNYRRGYYESYNAALEREFSGAVTLNVTYVGEQIRREVPNGLNINANQAPGQTAAQQPMKALYGISAGITSLTPMGTGNYNALEAQAKKRFSNGGYIQVNYTWSRSINDYGDQSDGEGGPFTSMIPYWRLNRGVAGFDRTHNIEIFGNYMLPFGKGQAFLQTGPGAYILGGWSVSGSLSRESGTPFTVTGSASSIGPSTVGTSNNFADVLSKSNMILGGHNGSKPYFNPANFQDPVKTQLIQSGSSCSTSNLSVCRFGTAGFHSLRGPGLTNPSISVARIFPITERFNMEFRAEAFNFINTPQFNNPSAATNGSNFGFITGTVGNSNRELRFSGRVTF